MQGETFGVSMTVQVWRGKDFWEDYNKRDGHHQPAKS